MYIHIFLEGIIFFVCLLIIACFKPSLKQWSYWLLGLFGFYLLVLDLPWPMLGLLGLLCLPLILLSIRRFRLRYITPRLLTYFKKVLPVISDTEQQALEAGDVGWESTLFRGQPDWQGLTHMPKSELTVIEQQFLDNQVDVLCAMLDDWEQIQKYKNLSAEAWQYIKKEGFLGIQIAQKYGGLGFSVWAHSHIVTKIASRSISAAIIVMVPNSVGCAKFIATFGTSAQKDYYLPRLASGVEIPAFALTSLEAGSDATALTDTGIICHGCYEEKTVLGIRLNWDKRYITLAPIASLLTLAFKLYDPDGLVGNEVNIGITLCLVPTHLPGISPKTRHLSAGLSFLNGPTRGHDVFIPMDFIIGGKEMRGKGWYMIMQGLASGRGISLPALSAATAKFCYRMTGAYARIRWQFGMPIGQFEGIAQSLGRIAGLTYLCEATRHFLLASLAQETKPALAAAITKYHLTEMARMIVNEAMDIHAGYAIQQGPHNYLWFLYQSLPIAITVEGANILTRNLIIFGQGALRCHPYLRDEINAAQHSQSLETFDTLVCLHLSDFIAQAGQSIAHGLTGGFFIPVSHQPTFITPYCKQLTRMSIALAFTSEIVFMRLGKQFKRKEAISARLGDILSHLYMASAVIKHYQDQACPNTDQSIVEWALQYCLHQIQMAFIAVLHNLQSRWLGRILYRFIFPWGAAYLPPSDNLTQQIAQYMLTQSAQRERMNQYCYKNQKAHEASGRVEVAFTTLEQLQSVYNKYQTFLQMHPIKMGTSWLDHVKEMEQSDLLTTEEMIHLQQFFKLQQDALKVDEFPID